MSLPSRSQLMRSSAEELLRHQADTEAAILALGGELPEDASVPPRIYGLPELKEIVDAMPVREVRSTGWPDLDAICAGGIQEGEAVLMAAEGAAGKTHFAVSMALEWARRGDRVFYLTAEDGYRSMVERMEAMQPAGTGFGNVSMAMEDDLTAENCLPLLKEAADSNDLIVIDNLDALPEKAGRESRYEVQALWVKELCAMVRNTRSSVLILHHFRKPASGAASGERADVRGDGRLTNRCGQVWLFNRSRELETLVGIRVDKHRRTPMRKSTMLISGRTGALYGIDREMKARFAEQYGEELFGKKN